MPLLNTSRLATFARLIALGYPLVLAAKGAGYRNMRASRAARRLAPRPAAPAPKEPRPAPAKPAKRETKAPEKAQVPAATPEPPALPAPPPLRMLTEEEWLLKYHPKYRVQNGAPP
jgi:hypothetical protein